MIKPEGSLLPWNDTNHKTKEMVNKNSFLDVILIKHSCKFIFLENKKYIYIYFQMWYDPIGNMHHFSIDEAPVL